MKTSSRVKSRPLAPKEEESTKLHGRLQVAYLALKVLEATVAFLRTCN